MKLKQQSVLLTGLLALSLAACTTNGMKRGGEYSATSPEAGTGTMDSTGGTASTGQMGQMGQMGDMGQMGGMGASGSTAGSGMGTESGQAAGAMPEPNATVTLIEVIPHPDAAAGTGAMGGSGAAGATGSATPDRVYRITVRTDQGEMRVVNQETPPAFGPGDRVYLPSDTGTMR